MRRQRREGRGQRGEGGGQVGDGETDEFCTTVVKDPTSVHNLQATIMNCLGIDHTRLTYKYQGRNFRLTDVEGDVLKEILT